MQALRAARNAASMKPGCLLIAQRRCLATATANQVHLNSAASTTSVAASSGGRIAPLYNIEASWDGMSSEEKLTLHEQLEALQVKDWKELSLQEKKAAYFVAFGPHGPRAPTSQPGDALKIFLSTVGLISIGTGIFFIIQSRSPSVPRTMTKEWQVATNDRAKEMNLNPISGISSEDYKGSGFVSK